MKFSGTYSVECVTQGCGIRAYYDDERNPGGLIRAIKEFHSRGWTGDEKDMKCPECSDRGSNDD